MHVLRHQRDRRGAWTQGWQTARTWAPGPMLEEGEQMIDIIIEAERPGLRRHVAGVGQSVM